MSDKFVETQTEAADGSLYADDALLKKMLHQLDDDANQLDSDLVLRLNQARVEALTAKPWYNKFWSISAFWPTSMVMVSLAMAVVIYQFIPFQESAIIMNNDLILADQIADEVNMESYEVISIMSEEEGLEFYEGLAFIEWLDQQNSDYQSSSYSIDPLRSAKESRRKDIHLG